MIKTVSFVALAFAFVGCSTPQHKEEMKGDMAMHGMHGMHANGKENCPMMAEGAKVVAEDTADGAALVFTTTGDVAKLRSQVAAMVEKHNTMHADGKMSAMMPASKARSEDIDGGARLILTPEAAADLDAVRAHVRKHADMAKAGECPMMAAPAA